MRTRTVACTAPLPAGPAGPDAAAFVAALLGLGFEPCGDARARANINSDFGDGRDAPGEKIEAPF